MNNQGVSGFLVRKTIQPFSLRKNHSNYDDFKNTNLVTYLNKRFGEQRNNSENNKIPMKQLSRLSLVIKPDQNLNDPKQNDQIFRIEPSVMKMIEGVDKSKVVEDFCVETQGVPKPQKWKKKLTVDNKLNTIIREQFQTSGLLNELYKNYQRKNMQTNIKEMQARITKGNSVEIHNSIGQANLKTVELVDDEQINFFLQQIIKEVKGMELESLLGLEKRVDEEENQQEENQDTEWEKLKTILQKRLNKQQLEKLFEKEEEDQRRKLVKAYKETKLDQFDVNPRTKQVSNVTLKRINEAYERQTENEQKKQTSESDKVSGKFLRSPHKYSEKFSRVQSSVRRLKQSPANLHSPLQKMDISIAKSFSHAKQVHTRSQSGFFLSPKRYSQSQIRQSLIEEDLTSLGSNKREATTRNASTHVVGSLYNSNVKMDLSPVVQIQSFIDNCLKKESQSKRQKKRLSQQMTEMETELNDRLRMITSVQNNVKDEIQPEFEVFKKQNQFQKKLINFLLSKTKNKSDLLSQKVMQQKSKQLIQSIEKMCQ